MSATRETVDVAASTDVEATPYDYAIWTDGLSRTYQRGFLRRSVPALRQVDLRVHSGEIFGFLGANGAGKSTTIKILTGLILPTRGRALVAGAPAGSVESRSRIGFLPENPVLGTAPTVGEFLRLSAELCGMSGGDARTEVFRLVERLDLGGLLGRRVGKLSKGQVQLLGVAHALLGNPPVYILDEPMSGLDPMARKLVRDILLELRHHGRTVFISSHILGDMELLCDRVGLIREGRLRGVYPLSSVSQSDHRERELVVSGIGVLQAQTLSGVVSARTVGEQTILTLERPDHVDAAIQGCLHHGGHVVSLTARTGQLESFVLSELAGAEVEDEETSPPLDRAVGGES